MELNAFLNQLNADSTLYVYPRSVSEAEGTCCAIVKTVDENEKLLAVAGDKSSAFAGEEVGGIRLCGLTNENAKVLMTLFPYTRPVSHKDRPLTMGLGDRLGLATPGHVRTMEAYAACGVFPVLAQQSIRELTLTNRTFEDVIAAAAFGVFQEGYKGGYGADGDHLKTKAEIKYALESGCTMITLDCSEHIDIHAAALSDEEVKAAYDALPEDVRSYYENAYLGKELPIIGTLEAAELRRIVLVFYKAVRHAEECYNYIESIKAYAVDFELSIDETRTITTPAEHFVVCDTLYKAGVRPVSVAPHFSGEFEKGIEYAGVLRDFARDFDIHQKIADHFGYKLSVHSGSDKFSVFSTVGRVTKGHVHVKTAGTNWLVAMEVLAEHDPALYRKAHAFAIEKRSEAEKYYHVSTKVEEIPPIELESDAYLPEYLHLPASRQTIHIAYGLLLQEDWFHEAFYDFMAAHEEEYYQALVSHIGRHLKYITAEM